MNQLILISFISEFSFPFFDICYVGCRVWFFFNAHFDFFLSWAIKEGVLEINVFLGVLDLRNQKIEWLIFYFFSLSLCLWWCCRYCVCTIFLVLLNFLVVVGIYAFNFLCKKFCSTLFFFSMEMEKIWLSWCCICSPLLLIRRGSWCWFF